MPHKELKECCNEHDHCYDECGSDRDMCDLYFKKCLYQVCKRKEEEFSLLQMKGMDQTLCFTIFLLYYADSHLNIFLFFSVQGYCQNHVHRHSGHGVQSLS